MIVADVKHFIGLLWTLSLSLSPSPHLPIPLHLSLCLSVCPSVFRCMVIWVNAHVTTRSRETSRDLVTSPRVRWFSFRSVSGCVVPSHIHVVRDVKSSLRSRPRGQKTWPWPRPHDDWPRPRRLGLTLCGHGLGLGLGLVSLWPRLVNKLAYSFWMLQ